MNNRTFGEVFTGVLQILIGLSYLGGGIFLMTSSQTFGLLPSGVIRWAIAVLLFVYGCFRSYRGIKEF